jgi:hypothetical protein
MYAGTWHMYAGTWHMYAGTWHMYAGTWHMYADHLDNSHFYMRTVEDDLGPVKKNSLSVCIETLTISNRSNPSDAVFGWLRTAITGTI